MSESVKFSYGDFQGMFPELKPISAQQVQTSFCFAEGLVNNTLTPFVEEDCLRKKLLYLLTAHIVSLNNRGAGNVGAISGAHEGSVGVDYSMASIDKLGAGWFGQTQYGLLFWQLTSKFRSGFFVP